jgi:hypothetical protein
MPRRRAGGIECIAIEFRGEARENEVGHCHQVPMMELLDCWQRWEEGGEKQ